MFEGNKLGAEIVGIVRDYVGRSFSTLSAKLIVLEQKVDTIPAGPKGDQGDQGEQGPAGKDGESIKGEQGPAGKDGESIQGEKGDPGPAGKDAEVDVEKIVADVIALIPKPQDGKDADPEAVRGIVVAEVVKAVAALPPPKDGKDGKDGKDALNGRDGLAGVQGPKGADGTNGTNGTDGKDGFSLDDFDMSLGEDGRTFSFRFLRDGVVAKEKQITVPFMLFKGVWREGEHKHGDTVTWDGSSWHANRDTDAKPGTSPDWTMCNKRGQNGKDGKNGERGERGLEGKSGRDLTQMGFNGAKY